MQLLNRYNDFYNRECESLPHGGPISPEHLQAIAIESMVKAFQRKHTAYRMEGKIPIDEMLELAEQIAEQGNRTVSEVSVSHRRRDLDTL